MLNETVQMKKKFKATKMWFYRQKLRRAWNEHGYNEEKENENK